MLWRGPFGGGAASGKSGAVVASHNRYGMYIRARVVPTDPATDRQTAMRSIFASLVAHWTGTLTAGQRAAWDNYAANSPAVNKLGDPIFLTGQSQYIRCNSPRLQITAARVDDGPIVFGNALTDPTFDFTPSEATQNLACTFDDTMYWPQHDDCYLCVAMGIPQSPSRNFYGSPWRLSGFLSGNTAVPIVSPLDVTADYPFAETQKIFGRARILLEDGRMSDWFRADAIAAA